MVLLDVVKGKKVRVTGFHGGPALVNKLRQVGLEPGSQIEILRQAPQEGPFLVRVGERTVVLERGALAKIQVEEIPRPFFRWPFFLHRD